MTAQASGPDIARAAVVRGGVIRSDPATLRAAAIAAGLAWSLAFVAVGLHNELQLYGDGAIFAYAVAVRDAWAFHWHNISGRLFVYAFTSVPGELFVALTGDARGGVFVYGLLQFSAPLVGLGLTFAVDRSPARVLFAFACLSTACLCPLVFGFPTEMWMAHSAFWPALAVCHSARKGAIGTGATVAMLLALVFTHEGALVFAFAILATLALRGPTDAAFWRGGTALALALAVWAAVKLTIRPDAYISSVLARAELNFIDVTNLTCAICLLLLAALAGYGGLLLLLRHRRPATAHIAAAGAVAAGLVAYWLWFDAELHTHYRYFVRTGLLIGTPVLGTLAAAYALQAEKRLKLPVPGLPALLALLARPAAARAAAGALLVVMLVHAVETAKFVAAWGDYRAAVRRLAAGPASDPALGEGRFVSSRRIPADLDRLSWSSTTPFLSVLLAPDLAPARLVVDPRANYFWLLCGTAAANEAADRAVPAGSRRLIRLHACLHR